MILSFFFLSLCFAQTIFKPIIDPALINTEAMNRTVFIRTYLKPDTSSAIRATGIILKDGYILTNEHVMRPHFNNKKAIFHIYTQGKRATHKFSDVSIIDCDHANDICLLKTSKNYKDSYFSFESPPYRKVTAEKPIGLFKDEEIYFNGFCDEFPKIKSAKYIGFTHSAYENNVQGLEHRKVDTAAIEFTSPSGNGVACGGDSGGPLFDNNFYLYGMVRDSVTTEDKSKNYAVPIDVLRNFYLKSKDLPAKDKIHTIMDFGELESAFK